MSRMKVSVWRGVETEHYQTRNMPVRTLNRLTAIRGLLGKAASKEMVFAMALEYGMGLMEGLYVSGELGVEEAKVRFVEDFKGFFWGEEGVAGDDE